MHSHLRILLTGGEGQLGTELIAQAPHHGIRLLAPTLAQMDLMRPAEVDSAWDAFQPEAVINAAAYTAVDRAESDAETAFAVNAAAPASLAARCASEGIPLIHISTDYVFDGSKREPYREDDPVAPLGVYGRSKAEGEAAVRSALDRHVIVRTAWLYSPHSANFVKTVMRLVAERDELRIVDDQVGSPTCADELAAAVLAIAARRADVRWGTYHYCGAGTTSWYGMARHVLETMTARGRLHGYRLIPIDTAAYPTPARRPAYSVLDCRLVERCFGVLRQPWQAGVERTVDRLLSIGGLSNH